MPIRLKTSTNRAATRPRYWFGVASCRCATAGPVNGCRKCNAAKAGRNTQRLDASLKARSEEHTSELQSLMRISYAVFCLKKKKTHQQQNKKNKQDETNR